MSAVFVYMTAKDAEEARRIGADLVQNRLAACVNVLDSMRSMYHWEGRVQEESEAVLIAKTAEDRVTALTERVKSLHSYDCPCIIVLPILGGHPEFIEWIQAETR